MPIEKTNPATEPNIFLLSTTELSVLKSKLDKVNQQKLKCEKEIDKCFSQLENKLLKKIPKDHTILKIINFKITAKENRTILECFLDGTFDREKKCLRKTSYSVKIFTTMMPVVINQQDLSELVEELNTFWFSNISLQLKVDLPYTYFTFTWL